MALKKGNKSNFRIVPDTNIIIAAEKSKSQTSPSDEVIKRWLNNEFILLYSRDTEIEYIKKLQDHQIPRTEIRLFIKNLLNLGERVEIKYYHFLYYPQDIEDIRFLLCADNGRSSHLVTYDHHLLDLHGKFRFKIVKPIIFLKELRLWLNLKSRLS